MLRPGQHIQDRYVVEELVGRGGLAEVYRVRHLQLGSVHALKLLLFRKKSLADRLLLEGRIQAQLRHPNVVAVTDVVRHDGQYGLLMEYVDNVTLEELIDSRGPMPVDEALTVATPILAGVHAAHSAGVLHRDLKPANVLLARSGGGLVPKVSDFGIAKVLDEGLDSSTRENVAMGTPGYMAPEQVLDARSVDGRTDVFALAGMVYELISGRRAFENDQGEVTVRSTLEGSFIPLHEVEPDVPLHVSEAVSKGISREREDRQGSVLELAEELLAGHPELLALVRGTVTASPITLDPSRYSDPGTSTAPAPAEEDEDDGVVTTKGQGPTLMPEPRAPAAGGDTFEGGQVAVDSLPPDHAAPQEAPVEQTSSGRRRAPPLFWTGVVLAVGLILVGTTLGVLVAGPALGWYTTPDGAAVRSESGTVAADGGQGGPGRVTVRAGDPQEPGDQATPQDGDAPTSNALRAGSEQDQGESAGGQVVDVTGDAAGATDPDDDAAPTASTQGTSTADGSADDATASPGDAGDASDGADAGDAGDGGEGTQAGDEVEDPAGDEPGEDAATDQAAATEPDASADDGAAESSATPGSAGSSTDSSDPGAGSGGTADDPGTDSPPAPPPRTVVMPMESLLAASWDGRVFRQPFTLRILSERGGNVVAEGRIVLGAQQRILRMTGRYDRYTGALKLKETNGSLVLDGTVSGSAINGTYRREGKGSAERLSLERR